MKVRSHCGATTETLFIMTEPLFKKKQIWWLLINTGTDDIQNNVNTLQKTTKVI